MTLSAGKKSGLCLQGNEEDSPMGAESQEFLHSEPSADRHTEPWACRRHRNAHAEYLWVFALTDEGVRGLNNVLMMMIRSQGGEG